MLQAGTRYHLLATYDGTNTRLYVDGTLVSTGPNATMASNGGANVMRFGAYSTGPGQYWPGVLDEASFYPAVLTAGQVLAHYEASVNGSTATSAATAVGHRSPAGEFCAAGGVGGGGGGADVVGVVGVVVGDGADLVCVSVASL